MNSDRRQATDAELVGRFRSGDEQAFNELVRRHQERVYWLARRIVGSHEEADDIVQDVLVRMYGGLKDFRGEASIATWLYRIAMNLSLNALRRKRLRGFLRLDELSAEPASDGAASDDAVMKGEYEDALQRAVDALPEKQKAVFILRYFEELSYAEIAGILRRSEGGLKANYFHAVRKIEQAMKREMR
jgi:RNA polymerase sigma-70 factor (ECF subfamily)